MPVLHAYLGLHLASHRPKARDRGLAAVLFDIAVIQVGRAGPVAQARATQTAGSDSDCSLSDFLSQSAWRTQNAQDEGKAALSAY